MSVTQVSTGVIADNAITTSKIENFAVTVTKLAQPFVRHGGAIASNLTSMEITALPGYVKNVTIVLNQISTTGTSKLILQFGTAAAWMTSGYLSNSATIGTAANTTTAGGVATTSGIALSGIAPATAGLYTGQVSCFQVETSPNTFAVSGMVADVSATACISMISGTSSFTNTSALTRIRLTTVGGTDTFDNGTLTVYGQ